MIGTWQTQYAAGASTDTLTLREGGTYKQVHACDFCYEGEGRFFEKTGQWWLEERSNGGLYLPAPPVEVLAPGDVAVVPEPIGRRRQFLHN